MQQLVLRDAMLTVYFLDIIVFANDRWSTNATFHQSPNLGMGLEMSRHA